VSETVKQFIVRVPRRELYAHLRSDELDEKMGQLTSDISAMAISGIKPRPSIVVEDVPESRIVLEERQTGARIVYEVDLEEAGDSTIVTLRTKASVRIGKHGTSLKTVWALEAMLSFELGYQAGLRASEK
jgi:hypothetical protein